MNYALFVIKRKELCLVARLCCIFANINNYATSSCDNNFSSSETREYLAEAYCIEWPKTARVLRTRSVSVHSMLRSQSVRIHALVALRSYSFAVSFTSGYLFVNQFSANLFSNKNSGWPSKSFTSMFLVEDML